MLTPCSTASCSFTSATSVSVSVTTIASYGSVSSSNVVASHEVAQWETNADDSGDTDWSDADGSFNDKRVADSDVTTTTLAANSVMAAADTPLPGVSGETSLNSNRSGRSPVSPSGSVNLQLYDAPIKKMPTILARPGKRLRSGGETSSSRGSSGSKKMEEGLRSSSSSSSSSDDGDTKEMKHAVLLVARLLQQAIAKCFPNVRKVSLGEGPAGSSTRDPKFKPSQKLLKKMLKVLNERPMTNNDNNKEDDSKSFKEVEAVLVLKKKKDKDASLIKKEKVEHSAKAASIWQEIVDKTKDSKEKPKKHKSKDESCSRKDDRERKMIKSMNFEKDYKRRKSKRKAEKIMKEANKTRRTKVCETIDSNTILNMMQQYAKEMNDICEIFSENTGKILDETKNISEDKGSAMVNNGETDEVAGMSEEEEEEMDDMWQILVNMADVETNYVQYGRPLERHAQEMLTIWENVDAQDSQQLLEEGQFLDEDSTIWQLGPDRGLLEVTNMNLDMTKDRLFVDGSSLWKYIIENADEETYEKLKQASAELQGGSVDKEGSEFETNGRDMSKKLIWSNTQKREDQSTSIMKGLIENVNMEEAYRRRKIKSKTNPAPLRRVISTAHVSNVEAKAIAAAIWQVMAEKADKNEFKDRSDTATDENSLLGSGERSMSDPKTQPAEEEGGSRNNKDPVTGLLWEYLAEKIYEKENAPIVRKAEDDESVGHLETELSGKEIIYTSNGDVAEGTTVDIVQTGSSLNDVVKVKSNVGINETKTKTVEVLSVSKEKTHSKTTESAQTYVRKASYALDAQSSFHGHSKKIHKDITRRATGSKIKSAIQSFSQERIYDKKTYTTGHNKSKSKISANANRQFETQGPEKRRYTMNVRDGKSKINAKAAMHSDKTYQQIVKTIGKQMKAKTLIGAVSKPKSPVSSEVREIRHKSPTSSEVRIRKPKSPVSSEVKFMKPKSPVASDVGFVKSPGAHETKRIYPAMKNETGARTSSPASHEIYGVEPNRMNSHIVTGSHTVRTDHKDQMQSFKSNPPPSNNLITILIKRDDNVNIEDAITRTEGPEMRVKSESTGTENDENMFLKDENVTEAKKFPVGTDGMDQREKHVAMSSTSPDRKTVEDGFTLIMSQNVNMKESKSVFNAILDGVIERLPHISLSEPDRGIILSRKTTTNIDELKLEPAAISQEQSCNLDREKIDGYKDQVFNSLEVDQAVYIREILKHIGLVAVDKINQKCLKEAREKTNKENNEDLSHENNEMDIIFSKNVGDENTTEKRTREMTTKNIWEVLADNINIEISRKEAELKARTQEKECALNNEAEKEVNGIIKTADTSHNLPFYKRYENDALAVSDATGEAYPIIGDEALKFEDEDPEDEDICQLRAEIAEWIASNTNINRKAEKLGGNTLDVLESVPEIVDLELNQTADEFYSSTSNVIYNPRDQANINEVLSNTRRSSDVFVEAEEHISQDDVINKLQKEPFQKITDAMTLNQTNVDSSCPQPLFGTDSISEFIGESAKIQDEEMTKIWRSICHKVNEAKLIVARTSLKGDPPDNLPQDGDKGEDRTEYREEDRREHREEDAPGKNETPLDNTGAMKPERRKLYVPCYCCGEKLPTGNGSNHEKESNKDDIGSRGDDRNGNRDESGKDGSPHDTMEEMKPEEKKTYPCSCSNKRSPPGGGGPNHENASNNDGIGLAPQGQDVTTGENEMTTVSGKENETTPFVQEWNIHPTKADGKTCYAMVLDLLNKTADKVSDICHFESPKSEQYPGTTSSAYANSHAAVDISDVLREFGTFNSVNQVSHPITHDEESEEFYPTVESWDESLNEDAYQLQMENNDEMTNGSWGMDISNSESTKTIVLSEKEVSSSDPSTDTTTDTNESLFEQISGTQDSEIVLSNSKTNSITEIDRSNTQQKLISYQYVPTDITNKVDEPRDTTSACLKIRSRLSESDKNDQGHQDWNYKLETEEESRIKDLVNAMSLELRSTARASLGITSGDVDAAMRRADEVIRRASDIERKLTDVIEAASKRTYNQLMKSMSSSGIRRRRSRSPLYRRLPHEAGVIPTAANLLGLLDQGPEEVDPSRRVLGRTITSNNSVPVPAVSSPPTAARGASTDPDITSFCIAFNPTDFVNSARNAVGDSVPTYDAVRDAVTETSIHAIMVNEDSDLTSEFPSDASEIYSDSAAESISDSSSSDQSSSSTSRVSWEGLVEPDPPALVAFQEHLERDGFHLEFAPVLICPHRHSPAQHYRPRHRAAATVLGVVAEASAVNEEVARRRATLLLAAELARRQVDGRLPVQLTPFSDDELLQLAALARAEAGNEGAETWLRTECQRRRRSPPRFTLTAMCTSAMRFPARPAGAAAGIRGAEANIEAGEMPAYVVECHALDLHAFGTGAHRHTARRSAAQEMLDILEKQRQDATGSNDASFANLPFSNAVHSESSIQS